MTARVANSCQAKANGRMTQALRSPWARSAFRFYSPALSAATKSSRSAVSTSYT